MSSNIAARERFSFFVRRNNVLQLNCKLVQGAHLYFSRGKSERWDQMADDLFHVLHSNMRDAGGMRSRIASLNGSDGVDQFKSSNLFQKIQVIIERGPGA